MKFLFLLIVVIIAAAAGYLVEPSMRMQLTGKPADLVIAKPKPKQEVDEAPFERNPVVPATPPAVVTPPAPVVPSDTEEVDFDQPVTPAPTTPTPPVVTEVPDPPVVQPVTPPAQTGDVVAVMKASIASGQISKFTAAQVLEWNAGTGSETIDGQVYQTGNVTYQAETPFGAKHLQAKALIKDGKVVRWISPKSGIQID